MTKLGVVGANTRGAEIVQLAALSGIPVMLVDPEREALEKTVQNIKAHVDLLVANKKIQEAEKEYLMGRIQISQELKALDNSHFILETLPTSFFAELNKICPKNTIFASTLSNVSITKLAEAAGRPEQVIGLHFIPPIEIVKLAEIVRGVKTDQSAITATEALAQKLGLATVMATDFPGFVVYRILAPMINEAVFGLYEGLGTAEEIDKAMKKVLNQLLGPLALADQIGLDNIHSVLSGMFDELKNPKYAPCPLLSKYVEAGYLGVKTGKGFYEYDNTACIKPAAVNS